MPRVLRIINRLNLGGPTYNAAYLTKYLEPEFETMLIAGMKDESEESSQFILDSLGITPVYIRNMEREISPAKDYDAYKQVSKIIHRFKPDIVHTHAAKAGTVGRIAAAVNKVPVILHTFHGHVFHSYFGPVKTSAFINIERFLARLSTGIIAISEEQKEDLTTRYKICSADKVHLVPLGFDLNRFRTDQPSKRDQFRKRFGINDDVLAIGIIGRLVPVKNHSLFIDVAGRVLSSTQKKIRFFIIGDGESRQQIEEESKRAGLKISTPEHHRQNADIVFTSWMLEIDIALAGLDVVVLTSKNEGTPVSLIEAQAAGKPVVTTEVGGIRNITVPGVTALLSASEDGKSMAENLLRLVENEKVRMNMMHDGPGFIYDRFHYTRLVNDMRKLYTNLLDLH